MSEDQAGRPPSEGPAYHSTDHTGPGCGRRRTTPDPHGAGGAVIEEATGALMAAHGIDAAQALDMLTGWAEFSDTALPATAERILTTLSGGADLALRTRFTHLLLTAHERI